MAPALLIFLSVVCGALLAIQVGANTQLRNAVGSSVMSALISFAVGVVALTAYALISRARFPAVSTLSQIPVWQWTGGLMGASYILATIIVGPRLGATTMLSLVVAGQMVAAIILDHFGLLGFAQHAANVWRLIGTVLLIAGTVLILHN